MWKYLLLGLVLVIAGILLFATTRPDTFRVQRSATIQAPPDKVLAYLEDFHRWNAWSPWEALDPAMQRSHSGPASGRGAIYAWVGNRKVGEGRMQILDVTPASVRIQLDFIKPFEGHSIAEFHLEPKGGATAVTWTMSGPNQYMGKVMGLFCDMDKMIGKDFEAGLAKLKTAAEK